MTFIFLGDVVGKGGRNAVKALLPDLRREFNAQFAVVNGENSAAGSGITASCAKELLEVADVVTLGDHTWDQKGFENEIRFCDRVIRPANYSDTQPGRGWGIFQNPAGGEVAVIALQGKVFMRESAYCPFETAEKILTQIPSHVKTIIVDFHSEASSEKLAMGYFLRAKSPPLSVLTPMCRPPMPVFSPEAQPIFPMPECAEPTGACWAERWNRY